MNDLLAVDFPGLLAIELPGVTDGNRNPTGGTDGTFASSAKLLANNATITNRRNADGFMGEPFEELRRESFNIGQIAISENAPSMGSRRDKRHFTMVSSPKQNRRPVSRTAIGKSLGRMKSASAFLESASALSGQLT
ncbi:MAG: hypothetical protein WDN28_12035 [Chthoniobacter sp.]